MKPSQPFPHRTWCTVVTWQPCTTPVKLSSRSITSFLTDSSM